jgi:ribose 5-phosphate isomerase B
MKLAVGADEKTAMADAVVEDLRRRGHELMLVGPLAGEPLGWPEVAHRVADAVATGQADEGVVACWTGTGVSMAANKVPGIRAALCSDAETARGARLWNNANVLALSLRRTSEAVAREILDAWFQTHYRPNPEDDAAIASLRAIEEQHNGGSSPHPQHP